MGKIAFLAGLALAVVCAFVDLWWLPWLVGGLGVAAGFLNVTAEETRGFLIATIGLVVALTAIHAQHYNPEWLSNIVFYARVFVAHALLIVALMRFFKTARD